MNYHNQDYYQNPLQAQVKQLEKDKQQLSQAIEELNMCYQQKINLLEDTISHQQQKYEELLEWKQNNINANLFEVEKYEIEIKKMIQILDNAHKHFEIQKEELCKELKEKRVQIRELKQENQALNQFNVCNENKIQEMVQTYTQEIEKLKEELKVLREQSLYEDCASQTALRQINSQHNLQNIAPNQKIGTFSMDSEPGFSKFSVHTVNE